MEPKLKKSVINKIIRKQIFVPSPLLLDQIPLLLTKKKMFYFAIQLESWQHKKGGLEIFLFCEDLYYNNIRYIKI